MNIDLIEGLQSTRAIRRYADEDISDEDLSTIMFCATRAPTGSNRQTFRFLVLRHGDRARQAKSLLGVAFRDGWAKKRSADSYGSGDGDSPKARMARTMSHFVDNFEATPVVVLACIERRHNNMHDGASIYPACQNILLASRGLGLGGVMTNWHMMVEAELHELLGIPDTHTIAATIPLGRPVGSHGPVRRRPVQELVFDDAWGEPALWATEPPETRHTQAGPPKRKT